MQTVSQSYSFQAYAAVQNGSPFSGNRTASTKKTITDQFPSKTSGEEKVSLSADGKKLAQNNDTQKISEESKSIAKENEKSANQQDLTQEELKLVTELQKHDQEVRTHEQAHLAAAGQYAAGSASFSYTTGPNGKRYVNGGSVPIDLSKEKTPEATIQKMRTVRRAALAPASPSGADRSIAAQAGAKEIQAMKEIQLEEQVAPSETTVKESSPNYRNHEQPTAATAAEQTTDEPNSPQISDFSRKTMTSAYQAIAALAT